jgi:hypothetical protein
VEEFLRAYSPVTMAREIVKGRADNAVGVGEHGRSRLAAGNDSGTIFAGLEGGAVDHQL